MTTTVAFNHVGPHLFSRDVPRLVDFYGTVLGLEVAYLDGDPAHYAVVFGGDVYLHLSGPGDRGYPVGPGAAFIAVAGVDTLWARVRSSAAEVLEPLAVRDYGHGVRFTVFVIRDPDGNILRIGEPLPRS